MDEALKSAEKPQIAFDVNRIQYATEPDREKYGEANKQFCSRLNSGEKFSVVFNEPLIDGKVSTYKSCSDDDLHYAYVVLPDEKIMPYPVFQQAAGIEFNPGDKNKKIAYYYDQENWQKGNWVGRRNQQEVIAEMKVTLSEFRDWMSDSFGKQFAGVTECTTSWDDLDEVAEAVKRGAEMAKGN